MRAGIYFCECAGIASCAGIYFSESSGLCRHTPARVSITNKKQFNTRTVEAKTSGARIMSWRRRWGEESGSNISILRFVELNELSRDAGLVCRCLCCSDLPHMNIVLCPLRTVMWGCCARGAHSFLVFPVLEA